MELQYYLRKYLVWLIFASVLLILFIFFFRDQSDSESFIVEDPIVEEDSELLVKEEEVEEAAYMIDVKGAVHYPGVYAVEPNERVQKVVELAGGFTDTADVRQINLAQKVQDEMVIYVPEEGEEMVPVSIEETKSASAVDGKVNINLAGLDELMTLQGIGPAKAQAIIDYREEHGGFSSLEDILQVNGIGEKTFENIKEQITI